MRATITEIIGRASVLGTVAITGVGIAISANASKAPKDYNCKVVITDQYLDDDLSLRDEIEEYNGDFLMSYYDQSIDDTAYEYMALDGSGDVFNEPYTIVDDGYTGDVFSAIHHTNGTFTKADDWLEITRYMGTVVYTNEEE